MKKLFLLLLTLNTTIAAQATDLFNFNFDNENLIVDVVNVNLSNFIRYNGNCYATINSALASTTSNAGNYTIFVLDDIASKNFELPSNAILEIIPTNYTVNNGNTVTNNEKIICVKFINNGIYKGSGTLTGNFINAGEAKQDSN